MTNLMKNKAIHIRLCITLILSIITLGLNAQTVGSIYRILSTNTGKAMTNNGNYNSDALIVMNTLDETDKSQMWALISADDGQTFGLFNMGSRQNVDMALTSSSAGRLLQWKTNLNNQNQLFNIHSPGIAGSAIQLLCSADPTLAVTEFANGQLWMKNDLTNTSTYFELKEVVNVKDNPNPLPYLTYMIHSLTTNMVLSNGGSNDNDARIIVEQPDEKAYGQMWKIAMPAYNKGNTAWYQLLSERCGKCIDVALDNVAVPLQWSQSLSESEANWNQMFEIVEVEDVENAFQLKVGKNVGSKTSPTFEYYYLAVSSEKKVYVTTDASSADTHFRFTKVDNSNLPKGLFWQDEKVFEENKEKGHATYIPYQSTDALRADERYQRAWLDPTKSTRWMSLNGTWKLKWNLLGTEYTMPEEEFYGDNVDASSWANIPVPACVEMHGFGTPFYINVNYAFADNPPYISMRNDVEDNSVSSYRRNFTLPEGWDNERILLHFDGIYSAAYVWVNGKYVGYTEGGNMDAEFDISKHVRQGENNLCVRVIRWTDGSYLEGQDMWHMSGIHRDVYLMAVPKVFVRDHYISAALSSDATSGNLSVQLELDNRDSLVTSKQYEVRLINPDGTVLDTKTAQADFLHTDVSKKLTVTFQSLSDLTPWTSDAPTLYTVEVVQKDADGNEESVHATKYGFCSATIKNNQFLLNGKRVLMKGVNTQDTHPLTGRTMDIETMWKDLEIMKQANVNMVRTSHYPRSPKMNAMMDYIGMYQMDEADVEFHKNWTDGGNIHTSSTWRAPIVDRITRMVLRDRNHPCVVSWSLGNESNGGINFTHAYNAARALDPRPIHYEGATNAGTSPTDIHSVMYRPAPEVKNRVDNVGKPYFMCEYAHAMGNSVGNLKEYWEAMESSKNGMGGCIWDWVDQAIVDYDDIKSGTLKVNGFNKYRNGHDYGGPHQGNFVNNGIITADRKPTGKLAEVKRIYQYIKFGSLNKNAKTVKVTNKYESIDLEGMILNWELLLNGEKVENGTMTLPSIPSDGSETVNIPYNLTASEGEYLLNISVCLPEATTWAPEGHAIAATQYALTDREPMEDADNTGFSPLRVSRAGFVYTIKGDNIYMKVHNSRGITEWTQGGIDVIPASTTAATAPTYSNYRWIENDAPYGTDPYYSTDNGISSRSFKVTVSADSSTVTITEDATGSLCNYKFVYTVNSNGTVDLNANYTAVSSNLRRIGMAMQFNPELYTTKYYARGPLSNTIDRKQGSDLGIYTLPVSDFHVDYVRPQTTGDRQDLRWIIFYNAEEKGILVETEGQVNMTLDNYTDEYKHNYLHQWELAPSDEIHANFDYAQLGIGNGSCGAGVLDKYKLPSSGTYSYRLRFSFVDNIETGITELPSSAESSNSVAAPIFNMRGQFVGNTASSVSLPKGIYISKGKKFIVR